MKKLKIKEAEFFENPWRRFYAAFADLNIFNLILTIPLLFRINYSNKIFSRIALIAAFALTYIASRIILNRQTIGMRLFEYKNVKLNKNKNLSVFQESLRLLSQLFNIIPLLLPYSLVFFTSNRVHLADLIVRSRPVFMKNHSLSSLPFQRFLGIYIISVTIPFFVKLTTLNLTIDIFGNFWHHAEALYFILPLILIGLGAGITNILGNKSAPFLGLFYFLIYIISHSYTLINMDSYKSQVKAELIQVKNQTQPIKLDDPKLIINLGSSYDKAVKLADRLLLPFVVIYLFINVGLASYFFILIRESPRPPLIKGEKT